MKNSCCLRIGGFVLAGFVAALDQWSKWWLITHVRLLPVLVLPVFNVTLVFNRGISFGMLAGAEQGWVNSVLFFCLLTITLMLIVWLARAQEKMLIMALGFIIGGAVGNLIDRVHRGVVTDFLDFHIGNYHWPAFNVADSAIFIGVVLFLITNIIERKPPQETTHE